MADDKQQQDPEAAEAERLAELRDLAIMDTPAEPEFDDLIETASRIAGKPIALMTLLDEDRQWFKARKGLDATETPRDVAFCNQAIQHPDEPLIVGDARTDPRFADNPLVTGDPHVAFYAGMPIVTPEGNALGTICVIDREPGELTDDQVEALKGISRQAAALLELRRRTRNLNDVLDQERADDEEGEFRDRLTGLPDRDTLEKAIATRDQNEPASLMVIELLRFSEVNAALGRDGGDAVLKSVARILAERLAANDTLARIDGTTFAAFMPRVRATPTAALARDLSSRLSEPIHADGFEPIIVSTAIGTASSSGDPKADSENLLESAEMATAQAKRKGAGSTVAAGSETLSERARRANLRTALRKAIADGAIGVVYMPVVELASGNVVGAEALARFPGAEFKGSSVEEIIHLAEEEGMVGDIDELVVNRAIADFAAGRIDSPSFGANISPVAIDRGLPQRIRKALDDHGVSPNCFVVEITERVALTENPDLKDVLSELSAMGIRIGIDDFGAGATAIADLRRLPFDAIKLDRGLITDIDGPDGRRALMVVEALTGMAQGLGIDVLGEGIETQSQREKLIEVGVTFGQGFLFGRPVTAGEVTVKRDPSELGAPPPVGAQMERLAGSFFDQSPDMATVSTRDKLLRVNENWQHTLGWTEEELLSRRLVDLVHPDDLPGALERLDALAEGEPTTSYETRFLTPDGEWRILDWNARLDPETNLTLATARDVTRERSAEMERDRLRMVMEVLSQLQEKYIEEGASRDWWHEALEDIIELSDSEYGFIGRVEHDENNQPYLISYAVTNIAWNEWSRGVWEEFKDGGLEFHNLETLFGVTLATGDLVIANDAPRDERSGGLPEGHPALNHYVGIPFNSDDGIVGMAGLANRPGGYDEELIEEMGPIFASLSQIISRDIARRRARQVEFDASSSAAAVEAILDSEDIEHAIEIAERAVRAIDPGTDVELYLIGDSRERLDRFTTAGNGGPEILHREACLGLTRGELHVSRPGDAPDQRCAHAAADSVTICAPVDNPEEEFGVVITDTGPGSEETGESSGERVGRLVQALEALASAVAEVARREDLTHRALTDSLTGLANRPAFVQSVNRSLDACATDGSCFGVMMLDLDNFKAVNDNLGHQAGDMLLEEAGQRIKDVLRDNDAVARLGGDEFGVIIRGCGTSADLLKQTCERVREAIAEMPVEAGLSVTASIGAVEVDGPDTSWDEIYRIADRELYASKKEGRDEVHVAPDRLGA